MILKILEIIIFWIIAIALLCYKAVTFKVCWDFIMPIIFNFSKVKYYQAIGITLFIFMLTFKISNKEEFDNKKIGERIAYALLIGIFFMLLSFLFNIIFKGVKNV